MSTKRSLDDEIDNNIDVCKAKSMKLLPDHAKKSHERDVFDLEKPQALASSQQHHDKNRFMHTERCSTHISTSSTNKDSETLTVKKTGLSSNPYNFSGNFPFFRQPREIGNFSIDSEMKFQHHNKQMKYYKPPPNPNNVSFDLRTGYESWIKRDENIKGYIDDMLRWILCNKHKFLPQDVKSSEKCLFTDFVCWRGLLTRVLCSPYENRDGWIIAVTRYKDTFYMCEFDTEEKIRQRESETEKQKEMCYGGYKFEQYLCASEPKAEPDTEEPVNSVEQFGVVVRSRLETHSLVFAGEVDCCDVRGKATKYIELKTSREISHPNQDRNFKRFKLIKWWAQSFLIGIPEIVCGFRDDGGIVHRLQTFPTMQIPEYCQDIGNCWKPEVCFNFLNKFLHLIKELVTENNPRKSYVFRWNPRQEITWSLHTAPSQYHFLPEWYYAAEDH